MNCSLLRERFVVRQSLLRMTPSETPKSFETSGRDELLDTSALDNE